MSAHDHPRFVEGCYRCELSKDELDTRFVWPRPEKEEGEES